MNKDKVKSNRREFLGIAGAGIAGLAIVSSAESFTTTVEASSKSRQTLETWLFNTGRDDMSPNLYKELEKEVIS